MIRLACRIARVRRGERVILKEQQVEFSPGVTSLLGLNGAGKTTLFLSLLGILRPMADSTIEAGDSPAISSNNRVQFMKEVGYLPQEVPALWSMRVRDFVAYAAWLKGMSAPEVDVMGCLARVNLEGEADTRMAKLSGGMRRRAGIAAALVHDPAVLLLDEPTAGLDPVERRRLHRVVVGLAHRRVVIVSTHLLEDVRAMPGQICVLGAARLTQLDQVSDEVSEDELIDLMQSSTP